MCAPPDEESLATGSDATGEQKQTRQTQMEADKEAPVSAWAVISFSILFVMFLFGVVATVARDFLPGGLGPPL